MENKRQDEIISLLESQNDWITGKKLAEMLNVSDRTIRADIEKINSLYSEPIVVSNIRSGYKIIKENMHLAKKIAKSDVPQTPNERTVYICKLRVQNIFGDKVYIESTLPYFEEKEILNINPDLLVSTVPLKHNLDIETIEISMFVNNDDEIALIRAINTLNKRKLELKFAAGVSRLIREEHYYDELDLSTPSEIIEYMCSKLYYDGIVDEGFKDAVLKREEKSPTSFVFSFAIPHPLKASSNMSTIAVAKLKHSVKWGEFYVSLVMLLAITEDDYETLKMFFSWMANAANDADKFMSLLNSKSYDEFMTNIIG